MKNFIFMTTLAAALFISACSSQGEEPAASDNEEKEAVEINEIDEEAVETAEAETDNYQLDETVEISGITLTINDAYLTDERNDNSIIDVSGVLVLDVTYENGSGETFPAGRDITLEAGGEHARSYDLDSALPADVGPGESTTGQMAYGLVSEPENMIAVFEPLMNSDGEQAIFDIVVE